MAGRTKGRKNEEKAKNCAATTVKYVSPLNRLCASVKSSSVSREHQMSDADSEGETPNVVIAFPTNMDNSSKQIISLENGIYDQANEVNPVPAGPPPVAQTPTTSGASTSDNMQFMSAGLATLSKEIASSFAHTMADLNTSIRGGFDSLRDRMDGEEEVY